MAKDRIAPCQYYIAKHKCSKDRDAEQFGYCQHCDKYYPRKGSSKLVHELRHKFKEKKYNVDRSL